MGHYRAGDSDHRYCTLRPLSLDRYIFHPRTCYVHHLFERCNSYYRLNTGEPGISTSVYAAGEARYTPLYTNNTSSSQRHLGASTGGHCGYVQSSGGDREKQAVIKRTFTDLITWPLTHYCILYLVLAFMIGSMVFYTGDLFQPRNPLFWLVSFLMLILSINWLFKGLIYVLCSSWYDLWFLRRKVQARQARASVAYEPMVSVIIPAYNEEVGLVATLKTVVASTYTNMEVIVINDGSSDGTEQEMRGFLQKYNLANNNRPAIPVRYRYQQKAGKGA